MTIAEIIILIIGAILFTVSFFIPDKGDDGYGSVNEESAREAVKEAVSEEIKKIKLTIEEATEESISDNKDKMERYMDRLTNEKMMAVNEYSDTVLEQIHKDHEEAVFLYDMIDNKYAQVKSTAAEINQIEKSVRKLSEELPKAAEVSPVKEEVKPEVKKEAKPENKKEAKPEIKPEAVKAKEPEAKTPNFEPISAPTIEVIPIKEKEAEEPVETEEIGKPAVKSESKKSAKKETKAKKSEEPAKTEEVAYTGGVDLLFDSDNNSMNNNDRILALHKAGKSNMAIAKELGLGVGEVKLVIDLFKNY